MATLESRDIRRLLLDLTQNGRQDLAEILKTKFDNGEITYYESIKYVNPTIYDRMVQARHLAEHPSTIESQYACKKCGKYTVYIVSEQRRSGDEGATLISTCKSCGYVEIAR